jgi:hypothetical protein
VGFTAIEFSWGVVAITDIVAAGLVTPDRYALMLVLPKDMPRAKPIEEIVATVILSDVQLT